MSNRLAQRVCARMSVTRSLFNFSLTVCEQTAPRRRRASVSTPLEYLKLLLKSQDLDLLLQQFLALTLVSCTLLEVALRSVGSTIGVISTILIGIESCLFVLPRGLYLAARILRLTGAQRTRLRFTAYRRYLIRRGNI